MGRKKSTEPKKNLFDILSDGKFSDKVYNEIIPYIISIKDNILAITNKTELSKDNWQYFADLVEKITGVKYKFKPKSSWKAIDNVHVTERFRYINNLIEVADQNPVNIGDWYVAFLNIKVLIQETSKIEN